MSAWNFSGENIQVDTPMASVMPVMVFTRDHKAQTIESIIAEVKRFEAEHGNPDVSFKLATGNVGVMAATNEAVSAAQWPIMGCVFGAVILLCLISFRSVRGTLCILIPLVIVSLLTSVAIFHVWYHYRLVNLGFELGKEINRHQALVEENRKLHLELATRKRTGTLEDIANRLGLRACEPSDVVNIKPAQESP